MLYRRFPLVVGSTPLSQNLPFQAKALSIDNPTNAWIKLTLDVTQFIPPYTMGSVLVMNDTAVRAEFLPPTGLVNPPTITAQFATLIYYDTQMTPSAGVGIMGNRAPYYDRNPLQITFSGSSRLAEGAATTTLWGPYTVPAGRAAYVEACKAITTIIQRYNSNVNPANGVGIIETPVFITVPASGVPAEIVNAKIVYGVAVGIDARDLLGVSMLLRAGDSIVAQPTDTRTAAGGTGASYHEADCKITEFDA